MTNLKDILKDIPKHKSSDSDSSDIMSDPEYVRASSKFISDSLRKGHDVLQLDNGDIVTTVTKTVTTQFAWDNKKKKMVRRAGKKKNSDQDD